MWLQDIEKAIARIKKEYGTDILVKDISPAFDSAIVFHMTDNTTIKYWYNLDEIERFPSDDWINGKIHCKW